ncbi:bifunctional 4-hydroxy-2-oxoglutarate aldolase/2-dehydro-3-deoxy-phosphogluconate aldolase [Alkalibacillus haloalkaliphilus]|uniref:bifunctional 4-hydroxy-2-oxoglutarate aldolase/2-dehydro-3-deoxy-phosphogluconate aldolase n=1 Tax=Alkalibacillus haloalkaliphilus TaxID=94136 RepID=UPI0002EF612C|nr:bifunctional 4-hydroxy-2-oxoglutarate aldolase/2-dehydro-3-deoxy-phosphogluconate aldolase [Alkalibacillus haloalkaliphilus]
MLNQIKVLKDMPIIAVVRGVNENSAVKLATALKNGGIHSIEMTFGEIDPIPGIKAMNQKFGDELLVGAGTVLTVDQVKRVSEAGAKFIFSPNTDEGVIKETKKQNLFSLPGAFSPTEIVQATNAGADAVKVFPASQLGPEYLKAIHAPLPDVKLVPTGGINLENISSFFEKGAYAVGVGGSLVDLKTIEDENFDRIEQTARAYVNAVRGVVS